MPKALDLTNQRFGDLIALKKAESRKGKTYWLCKCMRCGNIKEIQTGHLTSGVSKTCGCGINNKTPPVVAFRKRVKMALVEAFQHKCCCCGLEDDITIYDFHHLNPKEKEFGIGSATTTRSKQAYADEAKKCAMVCANCHRKIENGLITLNENQVIPFDETIYFATLEELIK